MKSYKNWRNIIVMTQYINKDALVAEIEKKIKVYEAAFNSPSFASYDACLIAKGKYRKLLDILQFINTLEVKEEVNTTDAFIEKACEWLSKNSPDYINYFISHDFEELVKDFRKAMKGE